MRYINSNPLQSNPIFFNTIFFFFFYSYKSIISSRSVEYFVLSKIFFQNYDLKGFTLEELAEISHYIWMLSPEKWKKSFYISQLWNIVVRRLYAVTREWTHHRVARLSYALSHGALVAEVSNASTANGAKNFTFLLYFL